ncbi:hypothetical protein AKH00_01370 [Microbacterium sp. GCS4]|nr:hypothetical protein AKH00_01370 [Microbacterium sp. GCS4]
MRCGETIASKCGLGDGDIQALEDPHRLVLVVQRGDVVERSGGDAHVGASPPQPFRPARHEEGLLAGRHDEV